jgi:hypothetical protein
MENTNNSLTSVAPQEGHSVSVVGDTYRIVIGSEQTNGAYVHIDMLIPPKGGPGPPFARQLPGSVLYNRWRLKVITKEKTYIATKGSYVNIPFNGYEQNR